MESINEVDRLFEECLDEIKNKHKKYSVSLKLKVIKLIEFNVSLHHMSNKLNIDR